jgi:aspartyl-tRNA(Asn)/glutamyl-tRNA(Gln) amidotransferase subunit B
VSAELVNDADALLTYDEVLAGYDPVLGLEVHVELGTASKMFCGCSTAFGASPNSQVCPTCLGLPGSLPVLNAAAVESAVRIGLALHCQVAPWCRFARKNYFYPDMPKNFQTSQYDEPICFDGYLDVDVDTVDGPRTFRVGIERAHMEEDTGKSLHVGGATGRIHGASHSLVDYNRAGIPLIEIVTKPIEGTGAAAPQAARAYVAELRDLLTGLGVSQARMELGQLRCDANLSLRPRAEPGQDPAPYGTRTETKNVNSLRSVERAIRFEMQRQGARLQDGLPIQQETRHFHENTGTTTSGRSKEEAEDYRYFPEPDLVPIAPDPAWVERLRAELPVPPSVHRKRLQEAWGVSDHEMQSLVNAGALRLVEETVAGGADPASARKWWLGEVARRANETGADIESLPITPAAVARVVALVEAGTLNDKLARQVIEAVLDGAGSPEEIVQQRGLAVVSDDAALIAAVDEALGAQPELAERIRGGKVQAAGAVVGQVMRATQGRADAARVRELVLQRLGVAD